MKCLKVVGLVVNKLSFALFRLSSCVQLRPSFSVHEEESLSFPHHHVITCCCDAAAVPRMSLHFLNPARMKLYFSSRKRRRRNSAADVLCYEYYDACSSSLLVGHSISIYALKKLWKFGLTLFSNCAVNITTFDKCKSVVARVKTVWMSARRVRPVEPVTMLTIPSSNQIPRQALYRVNNLR